MSRRPFVVHVAKLRRVPGTRWHEVRRGKIEGLACSGSAVPEGSEVEADVTLESVAGAVSVVGSVSTCWTGECRRCLGPASGTVRVQVLEHYTEDGDGSDTYPLVGDDVDLEPMVYDAVVLELPQAPLCSEDCKGLCPVCGADHNHENCSCDRAVEDTRWAVLRMLRVADADTDVGTEADTDTEADVGTEADTDTDADTGTDGDTDTDADTDTDTDADTDEVTSDG